MYEAHPAIAAPMRLRIDYARVVASLGVVDQALEANELDSLRGLCGALGLPPGATEGVVLFACAPKAHHVRDAVENLRDTELALALIHDLCALAMSDGKYHVDERKQIHAIAATMVVSPEEVAAIEDYVAAALDGSDVVTEMLTDDRASSGLVDAGGEFAASLAAAGVPVALVWTFGPQEISLSGVTAALERLGLGFGPFAGVAVSVTAGLLAYAVIRMTFRLIVR